MSCRSTPAGALATTWALASTSLFDGQTTSLYHALRREHATLDDPAVNSTQYIAALRELHTRITAADLSTARRARFEERYQNALNNINDTSNADRYALMGMTLSARQVEQRINRRILTYAMFRDMSEEDAHARYAQAYRSATRESASVAPNAPDGLPGDIGTRYAIWVLDNDPIDLRRCGTCGQFTSPQNDGAHTCPTSDTSNENPTRTDPRTPATANSPEASSVPAGSTPDPILAAGIHHSTPAPSATPAPASTPTNTPAPADTTPVDMDEFQDLYEKTQTSINDGEPFPFLSDPTFEPGYATANLGNPDAGGQTFGIELELDFPEDDYPYRSRNDLAYELWEGGVSDTSQVLGWHHIGDRREQRPGGTYQLTSDNWVCEFDRTVDDVDGSRGVEIKSQILTDTPDTWRNLDFILHRASMFDAAATHRTGLHVNIGSQGLNLEDPQQLTELLRTAAAYDDVLTRLAHNPASGTFHRGRQYCRLTQVPPTGFYSINDVQTFANHYNGINLSHLGTRRTARDSRVEIRIFDSSLDPGRIQTHINLSLALVNAAKNGHATTLTAEPAGTHRHQFGTNRLSGDDWESSTLRFRHFWSLMRSSGLNSPVHDRQLMRLFTASRWQRN